MITILLTSYNRPRLIRRTLAALLAQTNPNWRCILLDDNSNLATLKKIATFKDERIQLVQHKTTPGERATTVRYSALINSVLPTLTEGIVGYLCDNVEYGPQLVETVEQFFAENPGIFAGYVLHQRDVWTDDGLSRLGTASQYGHWDYTPPNELPMIAPLGLLDHSQVFHRLPVELAWPEDPQYVASGDGSFFTELVGAYGPIYPMRPGLPLTFEHLLESKV